MLELRWIKPAGEFEVDVLSNHIARRVLPDDPLTR